MKRSELVNTLELVRHALADNNLVPIFECFAFDGKTVSAYNDVLGIIAPCVTTEAFAVNGATLLGLLKNSHSEEVEFSIENKEDVGVKTGKSRFKLPYFTQEEFLFEPPADKLDTKIAITEGLLSGMEACLLTSSRDTAQAALLGVCMCPHNDHTALYSSDGDSITRYISGEVGSRKGTPMLPNTFCETVIRTVRETEAKHGFLGVNQEWAVASLDTKYRIYGRLIEVATPLDYEQEIAATIKGKPPFVTLPKGLDHALSRARVIADPESAKTVLEVTDGKLLLSTETHQGVVRDTVPCPKHPNVIARVSAGMVQRAIGLCDEMAILEGCTVYRQGTTLFMVVGNMG